MYRIALFESHGEKLAEIGSIQYGISGYSNAGAVVVGTAALDAEYYKYQYNMHSMTLPPAINPHPSSHSQDATPAQDNSSST